MRYCAFLRGINLGGRRVTGSQLCAPFDALGLRGVSSFLASGNVVFDTDDASDGITDTRDLEVRIEAALEGALGYPVETFVRAGAEVAGVVAAQPFEAAITTDTIGKPQVTFLRRAPGAGRGGGGRGPGPRHRCRPPGRDRS